MQQQKAAAAVVIITVTSATAATVDTAGFHSKPLALRSDMVFSALGLKDRHGV